MKQNIKFKSKHIVIVGMGIQGKKRKKVLGKDFIASVDIDKNKDKFKSLSDIPKIRYDGVYICVPDNQKKKIINNALNCGKHVLVEKPLILKEKDIDYFKNLTRKKNLVLYTAYNHRFEPGILKIKKILDKKLIGKTYYCKIFYGNGTSLLVKKNKWRDKGQGVITDLGSHLIDLCILFFGEKISSFKILRSNKFENKAPDHAILEINYKKFKIILEVSLCSWKNSFYIDLYGSKGSLHLDSLCKWSQSVLSIRRRILPAGKPKETKFIFEKGDRTWKLEKLYFEKLMNSKKNFFPLKDKIISNFLNNLK
ncbi:MAG: Gfo/Idh/MocA family oxidoreductase [Pseudomonadota bacterium]|nr:Gfo/Idh/MocA family oxidoreductase [Pseudomonadota bacterium]